MTIARGRGACEYMILQLVMPGSTVLGRVIRRARRQSGISQESLAAAADIDRTFMGEIERGTSNPSFEVLERIAKGLGVKLSELMRVYESEAEKTVGTGHRVS